MATVGRGSLLSEDECHIVAPCFYGTIWTGKRWESLRSGGCLDRYLEKTGAPGSFTNLAHKY